MNDQIAQRGTFVFGVPVAIVIAGALVAAAIYFSPSRGSATLGGTPTDNQPAPPEEEQVVVGDIRPVGSDDHIRGPENAKVTIVEYSDLECPFCKRHHETMLQVLKDYPNDVRWVYRHFPLVQLHSKAPKEAEATECAGEQGKFWEMTDLIFEITPANDGLDLAKLPDYARQAGVANIAQFQACLDGGKYAERVAKDLADAETAGGQGTPHSVIISGDTKIPISGAQPIGQLKSVIDGLLKQS